MQPRFVWYLHMSIDLFFQQGLPPSDQLVFFPAVSALVFLISYQQHKPDLFSLYVEG